MLPRRERCAMPGTAGHQEALGLALWTADEGRGSKLVPTVVRGPEDWAGVQTLYGILLLRSPSCLSYRHEPMPGYCYML